MELFLYLGKNIQQLINFEELEHLLLSSTKNKIITLIRNNNITYSEIINACIKMNINIDDLDKIFFVLLYFE